VRVGRPELVGLGVRVGLTVVGLGGRVGLAEVGLGGLLERVGRMESEKLGKPGLVNEGMPGKLKVGIGGRAVRVGRAERLKLGRTVGKAVGRLKLGNPGNSGSSSSSWGAAATRLHTVSELDRTD